jgi:hypothetical protein
MGTFAETALVDRRLSFAYQGKYFRFPFRFQKTHGSFPFPFFVCSKQMEVAVFWISPFAVGCPWRHGEMETSGHRDIGTSGHRYIET